MNHMEMDHKRFRIGPETPQMIIVHPNLMHILSYFMYLFGVFCFAFRRLAQINLKRSFNMPAIKTYRADEYLTQCIKQMVCLESFVMCCPYLTTKKFLKNLQTFLTQCRA